MNWREFLSVGSQDSPDPTRVLLTGAAGLVGRVVLLDLLNRGYHVRATTSKARALSNERDGALEWRHFDFLNSADYDDLVSGCAAVLHVAGEKGNMQLMRRVNVEATRLLAEAAERAGVRAFCYTSSVTVYGSGLQRTMSEDAPVLTTERDVRSEYWALDYVRMYGRTKLAGELELGKAAKLARYIVLRPTFIVDIPQIVGIRDWSFIKRTLTAHRHAHYIYVRDVSDALIWSMERGLAGSSAPGRVEIFNLSDDECEEPTHADFLRQAFAVSGDPRFKIVTMPWLGDWLHDFLRFRSLPLRNPLWRMRFPDDRIRAAGYQLRFGMAQANAIALETLRQEQTCGTAGSDDARSSRSVDPRRGS
jgi:nucleoside-diphosphate-sugar epimerase